MFFSEFFIDTAPIVPTIYDELGLAAEGPSSSTDGGDQATLDFPGLDFGEPLTFGMDNIYAPFDGPSLYSNDPLFSAPLWNTDNLIGHGNSGLPSTSSGRGTDDVASGHAACQTAQSTERRFALDISNAQERVAKPLPQPLSASASSVSPAEVETPTNSSYAEDSIDINTASSSPAGKSAKQRRSADSSAEHETNTNAPPSRTRRTKAKTPRRNVSCIHPGCKVGPFHCEPTMQRHVVDKHLDIHFECPGCRKTLSRPDALTRHLNTRPVGSSCRAAAKTDGWREDRNGRLSLPGRTSRAELIAAVYGRTR